MDILRSKRILSLICCLCVLVKLPVSAESEVPELYARSAVLMDGDSGRILYEKEAEEELPMASTTKIMTCIVALEQAELEQICTASDHAAAQPKVRLGMKKGEQFYLKDLLYSLMLESHNDTAVCIAENVAGSVEQFADRMNQKAAQIGCSHTYYITPNGLDAEDGNGSHHTTAAELAAVMRYCVLQSEEADTFLQITQTQSHTFSNVEGTKSYGCVNHNTLLQIMDGAVSGKTGFTGNAGYCYVGAVRQEDKFLIVALLACGWPSNKGYKWVDTRKLVRYGMENFEKRTIIDRKMTTKPISVINGKQEQVQTKIQWTTQQKAEVQRTADRTFENTEGARIYTEPTDSALLYKTQEISCQIQLPAELFAPVTAGTMVGTVSFLVDNTQYASFPIVAAETVQEKNYTFILKNLSQFFVNFMTKKLAIF